MWTAITTDLVKTRLAGVELTALQSAALATAQADPLPSLITQTVDEVRGYISAGGHALETGTTVPSKLISATLAILRYRLATRLPAASFLTDVRKEEYRDALRLLERVADGKFAIEEPVTLTTEIQGQPIPAITERTASLARSAQDGI